MHSEEYSANDYRIPPMDFEKWREENWISANECPTVWRRKLPSIKERVCYVPVAIQPCLQLANMRRQWRVLYRAVGYDKTIWLQVQSKG